MDPGAGAVVEHAVVNAAAAEAVGHRGQRGGRRRGVVRVLGGLLKSKSRELISL